MHDLVGVGRQQEAGLHRGLGRRLDLGHVVGVRRVELLQGGRGERRARTEQRTDQAAAGRSRPTGSRSARRPPACGSRRSRCRRASRAIVGTVVTFIAGEGGGGLPSATQPVQRRERGAHDVLLGTVVDAPAQLGEVGDHTRLVPLPTRGDAVVERALVGVRGAGHLPRADEVRVGLQRLEEAETEQVRLRLEHHHRHAQIGADVRDLRYLAGSVVAEVGTGVAAAVDHEAVVDVRARRDRVHVGDQPRGRLRLTVGDEALRMQRAERARTVGMQDRLRGLREDVVRVLVARMMQRLVARRILIDEPLRVVARDRDLDAAGHTDLLRSHPDVREAVAQQLRPGEAEVGIGVAAGGHVEPLDDHGAVELLRIDGRPHEDRASCTPPSRPASPTTCRLRRTRRARRTRSRCPARKYSVSWYPYCDLYDASIAFIGMSGVPPVTGPITFGTATAVFNGRVDGVVGAGAVVVGGDDFGVACSTTSTRRPHASASTLAAAIAGRSHHRCPPCRASATLDA